DKNQCHHADPKGHDRTNGRIFKIAYGDTKWQPVNLQKKTDGELINLAINRGDWTSRHARRLLQERSVADASLGKKVLDAMPKDSGASPNARLHWVWAAHVTGGLQTASLNTALRHND